LSLLLSVQPQDKAAESAEKIVKISGTLPGTMVTISSMEEA
jgi:hypothetical protein